MTKVRMTTHQVRVYQWKVDEAFKASGYRIDGTCDQVADALRAQGVDICRALGIDRDEIIRQAENEAVRKRMRDAKFRHEGKRIRSYIHDGRGWIYLPGRLWLMTRNPDEPGAKNRRAIVTAELEALLKARQVPLRQFKAIVEGIKSVIASVKAGQVYEQPNLFKDDTNTAA